MAKIIIHDYVNCSVENVSNKVTDILVKKFSKYVPNYKFMPKFKLGIWDGKIYFYTENNNSFVSFLLEIFDVLSKHCETVEIEDLRKPCKLSHLTEPISVDKDYLKKYNENIELRYYQVDAINAVFNSVDYIPRGMINACTGAGKTLICAAICLKLLEYNCRTIIVVPSSDLVTQTVKTFNDLNVKVGQYSGTHKDSDHNIVVATWQTLRNSQSLITEFDAFIIDECHQFKCNTLVNLANNIGKNIPIRIGCTGSIPDVEVDKLSLRSGLGDVVYTITADVLIKLGYLSTIEIEMIELNDLYYLNGNMFPDLDSETEWKKNNILRVEYMAKRIKELHEKVGNVLVLTSSREAGIQLASILECEYVDGKVSKKKREEIYRQLDTDQGIIAVATTGVAGTGISIDNIHGLVFIDYLKSMIKTIQSVGRGLRKKTKGDNHVVVQDFFSNLKYGKKHASERLADYKKANYPTVKKMVKRYDS